MANTNIAEHPLLTKDRETADKGHHHPTEHEGLHHHLRLDIEREEKKRQDLKYLKIKNWAQSCPIDSPTHYHRHARQCHCVQLPHHQDVVDHQDYQQERVCRQQGLVLCGKNCELTWKKIYVWNHDARLLHHPRVAQITRQGGQTTRGLPSRRGWAYQTRKSRDKVERSTGAGAAMAGRSHTGNNRKMKESESMIREVALPLPYQGPGIPHYTHQQGPWHRQQVSSEKHGKIQVAALPPEWCALPLKNATSL